jgi:hypothetical protein
MLKKTPVHFFVQVYQGKGFLQMIIIMNSATPEKEGR